MPTVILFISLFFSAHLSSVCSTLYVSYFGQGLRILGLNGPVSRALREGLLQTAECREEEY